MKRPIGLLASEKVIYANRVDSGGLFAGAKARILAALLW
jgi:hypothetical protein